MSEIDRFAKLNVTRKVTFNFDKYITNAPKRVVNKNKKGISIRVISKSRSPMRIKINEKQQQQRSSSNEKKFSQQKLNRNFNLEENATTWSINDDHSSLAEANRTSDTNAYHSKKLNRHMSLVELSNEFLSGSTHNLAHKLENNIFIHDISLNDSMIYYTLSDSKTNGIIFAPQQFDLSSSLFSRIFYNYAETCFKIQTFFDNCNLKKVSFVFHTFSNAF